VKRTFFLAILFVAISAGGLRAQAPDAAAVSGSSTVETLVCFRHGEKPPGGLGQITPRGLNRALALPKVLIGHYGRPQYLFAPDPADQVTDAGVKYSYVRPLATIEPTAIYLGMPVNTQYGAADIAGLQAELAQPQYRNAVVFIAWEHLKLHDFVQNELNTFHSGLGELKAWPGKDYDTILVVKITRQGGSATAALTVDHEGLDGVSSAFPGATP
jgi:hypothetical protein